MYLFCVIGRCLGGLGGGLGNDVVWFGVVVVLIVVWGGLGGGFAVGFWVVWGSLSG